MENTAACEMQCAEGIRKVLVLQQAAVYWCQSTISWLVLFIISLVFYCPGRPILKLYLMWCVCVQFWSTCYTEFCCKVKHLYYFVQSGNSWEGAIDVDDSRIQSPQCQWHFLSSFRTGQSKCCTCLKNWRLASSDPCECCNCLKKWRLTSSDPCDCSKTCLTLLTPALQSVSTDDYKHSMEWPRDLCGLPSRDVAYEKRRKTRQHFN